MTVLMIDVRRRKLCSPGYQEDICSQTGAGIFLLSERSGCRKEGVS